MTEQEGTDAKRPTVGSTPPPGAPMKASAAPPPPGPGDALPPAEAIPGRSTPPPRPGSPAPRGGSGDQEQPAPKTDGFFLTRYVGIPVTGWHGINALVGVMIAALAMIIGTILVAIFDPQFDTTAGKDAAQLMVALALGGTAIGFALFDSGGKLKEAFGKLGMGARITFGVIGLALLAWLIYVVFAAILTPLLQPDQKDVTNELGTNKDSIGSIAIAGFLIVILAPLTEEMFFRGFMFASLRRSMSLWPAAAIAAVVWGSLHLSGGNIGVAIQLSVFGVILAWLYERSGSLWAPITAHALNNTIAFILLINDST